MELNLSEIVWPICLLRCDTALSQLKVSETLDLAVNEADLISSVTRIINSHHSLTYEINRVGDEHRIIVFHRQLAPEIVSPDPQKTSVAVINGGEFYKEDE